jgi:hypothetical protein
MSRDPGRIVGALFPGSLGATVGDVLRVAPTEPRERTTAASWLRRFSDTYEVTAADGSAGAISGIVRGAPRIASAEGTWSLTNVGVSDGTTSSCLQTDSTLAGIPVVAGFLAGLSR